MYHSGLGRKVMIIAGVLLTAGVLALIVITQLREPAESNKQTVAPQASDDLLVNPGRGWVVYGSSDGFSEVAPEVLNVAAVGYKRFSWGDLNPAEGVYNWEPVEKFLAGWAANGKTGAFGVMAANSHSREPFVTPEWVFKAGAEYKKFERKTDKKGGRKGVKVVPDFDHPVFLAKLEKFVNAFAEKFDGDPRIEFIDIRSYGNWGETHMSQLGQYDPITSEKFLKHVKIYQGAFDNTQLILPLNDDNEPYKDVAEWAIQNGIGVRRDGVVGNSDGSETAIALGREPAVFEYYGSYEYLQKTGYWEGADDKAGYGFPLPGCVERGHPTYMQLGWWGPDDARLFYQEQKSMVEQLHNRIGYCFELTRAQLPRRINAGEAANLTLHIANRGVAPIYIPVHPMVALLDEAGEVAARAPLKGVDPAKWRQDETTVQTGTFTLGENITGTYTLALGLFTDRDDDSPAIALAIRNRTPDRWHPLAEVTVKE